MSPQSAEAPVSHHHASGQLAPCLGTPVPIAWRRFWRNSPAAKKDPCFHPALCQTRFVLGHPNIPLTIVEPELCNQVANNTPSRQHKGTIQRISDLCLVRNPKLVPHGGKQISWRNRLIRHFTALPITGSHRLP